MLHRQPVVLFFFFNDTATTEIYTLSLHDALPISSSLRGALHRDRDRAPPRLVQSEERVGQSDAGRVRPASLRSEEHTSELQSRSDLVCRLLLEKKKKSNQKAGPDHRAFW